MISVEQISRRNPKLYRCPDDISNFKIRVKLKSDDSEEVQTFVWQEKRHSPFERDFYRDEKNCVTELEKEYNRHLKDVVDCNDVVFSYVSKDNVDPDEDNDYYYLPNANENNSVNESSIEYEFGESLQKAINNPLLPMQYDTMYIMADFGEYYENTWIKCEKVICAVKYNEKNKTIWMSADYTTVEPYVFKINTDKSRRVELYLENASLDDASEELLRKDGDILDKVRVYERKMKTIKISGDFSLPPSNVLQIHILMEILCARNFENPNIYVQYVLELPKYWKCTVGSLTGVTQASKRSDLAHFSFPFEITLDINFEAMPKKGCLECPFIYFEVISKDTWSRFRSEGVGYRKVPIEQPGLHRMRLQCLRLSSGVVGNLRRFFVGDCCTYEDLSWFAISKNHEGNVLNKFGSETVATGELDVRMSILHQSRSFVKATNLENARKKLLFEQLEATGLARSVDQVVQAFRAARKNMLEARKKV